MTENFNQTSESNSVKWGLFHEQLINIFPRLLELFDNQEVAEQEADRLNNKICATDMSEAGPEERYFIRALRIGRTAVETRVTTDYTDAEGRVHPLTRSVTEEIDN